MAASPPRTIAFAIRGPITRADLPRLCERVCAVLESSRRRRRAVRRERRRSRRGDRRCPRTTPARRQAARLPGAAAPGIERAARPGRLHGLGATSCPTESRTLRVEPVGQSEEREHRLGVEEERQLDDPAVRRSRAPGAPTARSPRRSSSACTARTPACRSRPPPEDRREPRQPAPGPTHQVRMSSRPLSHRSYGGIDCVASSWISDVSASMS